MKNPLKNPLKNLILFFLLLIFFCLPASESRASGFRPKSLSVAMRTFGVWEPESRSRVDIAVWYPANTKSRYLEREGWHVVAGAGRATKIIPAIYPVILISHDSAGSRFANNDLAASLAMHGFIVIAPTHSGDNIIDSSKIYTAEIFYQRPRNVLLALQTILADPDLAPYIDISRIGLLGVGFGAITVAQISGIAPVPDLLLDYCSKDENENDPFCSSWSGEVMSNLKKDTRQILKRLGPDAFTPAMDYKPSLEKRPMVEENKENKEDRENKKNKENKAKGKGENKSNDKKNKENNNKKNKNKKNKEDENLEAEDDSKGRLDFLNTIAPLLSYSKISDKKTSEDIQRIPQRYSIKSIAFISPAGGMLFPVNTSVGILPSLTLVAEKNELYPYAGHAKPYAQLFPALPLEHTVLNADHYSLFAPCTNDLADILYDSCRRLEDKERKLAAISRDKALANFFMQTLGVPLPPPILEDPGHPDIAGKVLKP